MKNVVPGTCWAGYIHVHHVPGISGTHVQYMYRKLHTCVHPGFMAGPPSTHLFCTSSAGTGTFF
jgi:hypothetical protein